MVTRTSSGPAVVVREFRSFQTFFLINNGNIGNFDSVNRLFPHINPGITVILVKLGILNNGTMLMLLRL